MTVATGLLVSWQLAPLVLLLYFVGGRATDRALRKKRDAGAYREGAPNRRKGNGNDTDGKATDPSEHRPLDPG